MRSMQRSRYYVQCPLDDHIDHWPDDRFWDELKRRLDREGGRQPRHRPLDRKEHRAAAQFRRRADAVRPDVSGRRRRAYRAADRRQGTEPRRQRRALPLAGACANITTRNPPPGSTAIPPKALARVWKAVRFSWWMTSMLHKFPDDRTIRRAHSAGRAGLSRELEGGDDVAVGELRRTAVLRIRRCQDALRRHCEERKRRSNPICQALQPCWIARRFAPRNDGRTIKHHAHPLFRPWLEFDGGAYRAA